MDNKRGARIIIIVLAIIAGGVLGASGMFRYAPGGVLLGLFFGLVLGELISVRTRLSKLEQHGVHAATKESEPEAEEDFQFTLVPDTAKQAPDPQTLPPASQLSAKPSASFKTTTGAEPGKMLENESLLDRIFAEIGKQGEYLMASIANFFTGGNLVLRVGIVILFIGVSFLIKYAAQRNMLPLGLRLAGAALGGLVLLLLGWRLRDKRGGYGLVLQGGGIGILYLVIFGAGRLYDLVPPLLAFGLMVGLVALSCLLAILQDSRSLALFGSIGGFLAPVLMSSGGGNHVLLFAYFALLNGGIVGIAWFKAWRELNLIGFLFTFGIGTLWGSSGYVPEHFATTEPFLLLFFVFYLFISILFALRQQVNLRGFIDGPLVFGLPLVVSALQYFLVKDFEFGMAFSALGFGCFYLTTATVLWKRLSEPLRLLCETFLALGVVYASLTIPLALDGRWSGAIWALEGAGMVWVGTRQSRLLARHFGVLLQFGAGFIFLNSVLYPLDSKIFANQYFLGCLFLALAALLSSYVLDRYHDRLRRFEQYYAMPLMIVGLAWWFIGGIQEIDRQFPFDHWGSVFLFYLSATSIICGAATVRLNWPRLRLSLLLQLPGMFFVLAFVLLDNTFSNASWHFLSSWGGGAWLVGFFVLYRILYAFGDTWPNSMGGWYHTVALWLLIFILGYEAGWLVDRVALLGDAWTAASVAMVPVAALVILLRWSKTELWPVGKDPDTYLGAGAGGLALSMIVWIIMSFTWVGDPLPLPYIPVVNPLELTGLAILFALLLRALGNRGRWIGWRASLVVVCFPLVGLLFFIWLNSVVARSVHFFSGIDYHFETLWASTLFQAAIAALWGVGALIMTVWAARHNSRTIWAIGAMLLGLTVIKLFLVDLSGSGTVARIVSFIVVGVLMLIIGYFSPIPPKIEEKD